MNRPFFSIIIATYNSQKTLEYTLKSIDAQTIDKSELEVIVIDGGSTDSTVEIAQKYGTIILKNPYRLPEYAKAIGVGHATGHYVMRMDSDEEFSYENQLQEKKEFLIKYPDIKMMIPNRYISGRKEICGISAEYMNILGDPFSYFVYNTKPDKYITYKKNIVLSDGKFAIMKFEEGDVYPLADSATSTISLDYIKEKYPETYDSIEFTCGAFDRVIKDTQLCGIIKGDDIKHNCDSSLKTYFSKLRFRVVNNLFHKEESGFSAKEDLNRTLTKRKMLFCLYALIVPIPLFDSIKLAILYKKLSFLLHFVYLYYVCVQIFILGVVKVMGGIKKNKIYGK